MFNSCLEKVLILERFLRMTGTQKWLSFERGQNQKISNLMTGGNETGNRRSLKVVQNDRDYDRGFVGVSMGKLAQKEQYYHY